ncbi:MAG: lytic transglycosylase domain-containing protein [Nocardiopsaceae bacterium]|nr:lytic transglycosylase domain-containing protein [Nocardiopsaceae bacterium]
MAGPARPGMIHADAFQPGEFQPAAGPDLTVAGTGGRAAQPLAGTGGYTGLTLDAMKLTGARARAIARHHGPVRGLAAQRRPARHRPARHRPGHRRVAHRHRPAAPRAPRVPQAPRQIARLLLSSYHWAQWQFRYLSMLWMRESGWNPHALNPGSGAYGIPQAVPGAKMASAGPDWRWNPRTQIRWGLTYIAGRYGSPLNAWQHESGYGWC